MPRLSPAERLGIRTDQGDDGAPLIMRPWFMGVAALVAGALVTVGIVMSSGGTFAPTGELGNSRTSDPGWTGR